MHHRAPLLEINDLPEEDMDLSIAVEDGNRLRFEERRHGSVRGVVVPAARLAQREASKTAGRIASAEPASIRAPRADRLEMEFDVIEDGQNRSKPRSRKIRVVVMSKERPKTR